jgi:hypothetical protein
MIKVAVVVWIVLGASLAGCCMVAVLALAGDQAMTLIPKAVLAGFIVAVPLSFLIARKIAQPAAR